MTIATNPLKTTGPVLLVDNLWNTALYPNHTISADEEATDHEATLVGNGRRRADDHWTSTTQNSEAWNKATCDVIRGANALALDRGHNLGGEQVILEVSNNNTGWTQVFDITLPSTSQAGSGADALGVVNQEGAWFKFFDPTFARYWRLRIPAMGAGLTPKVVNIHCGTAYTPEYLSRPAQPNASRVVGQATVSDAAWKGTVHHARPRSGVLRFKVESLLEYVQAGMHVEENFNSPRPMWLMHDYYEGHRAVMVMPNGPVGFRLTQGDTAYHKIEMPWIEHEARVYQ